MTKNGTLLGTFIGKCCDSNVMNANGMFLSKELFDNLIASDEYKNAIKNRYYIGFLGHPEDPNDMNFKNACVVMTDMWMESNGDITGSFDLIDTPVGRIVKSFIDAGVNFGISIRGAGDVDKDGTVDPDTFIFRGFDLVTFPAYDDCIPEFQEIAASTDVEAKKKYNKIHNAVKDNITKITSCEALDVLSDHFNEASDEYKMINEQRQELESTSCPLGSNPCEDVDVEALLEKVRSLESLLAETILKKKEYNHLAADLQTEIEELNRKHRRLDGIISSQNRNTESTIESLKDRCSRLSRKVAAAKDENANLSRINAELEDQNNTLSEINASLRHKNGELVSSCSGLKKKIESCKNKNENDNLLLHQKVEAGIKQLSARDKEVESLAAELDKTVAENKKLKGRLSNVDGEIDSLKSQVEASEKLIYEYQQAYADSCAFAVGTHLDNIPVTASTTAEELKSYIYSAAANSSSICPQRQDEDEETGLIAI